MIKWLMRIVVLHHVQHNHHRWVVISNTNNMAKFYRLHFKNHCFKSLLVFNMILVDKKMMHSWVTHKLLVPFEPINALCSTLWFTEATSILFYQVFFLKLFSVHTFLKWNLEDWPTTHHLFLLDISLNKWNLINLWGFFYLFSLQLTSIIVK